MLLTNIFKLNWKLNERPYEFDKNVILFTHTIGPQALLTYMRSNRNRRFIKQSIVHLLCFSFLDPPLRDSY